jgi:hypothetical protein
LRGGLHPRIMGGFDTLAPVGGVAERLNAPVLKTGEGATSPPFGYTESPITSKSW